MFVDTRKHALGGCHVCLHGFVAAVVAARQFLPAVLQQRRRLQPVEVQRVLVLVTQAQHRQP